jgi:hypothetical protein
MMSGMSVNLSMRMVTIQQFNKNSRIYNIKTTCIVQNHQKSYLYAPWLFNTRSSIFIRCSSFYLHFTGKTFFALHYHEYLVTYRKEYSLSMFSVSLIRIRRPLDPCEMYSNWRDDMGGGATPPVEDTSITSGVGCCAFFRFFEGGSAASASVDVDGGFCLGTGTGIASTMSTSSISSSGWLHRKCSRRSVLLLYERAGLAGHGYLNDISLWNCLKWRARFCWLANRRSHLLHCIEFGFVASARGSNTAASPCIFWCESILAVCLVRTILQNDTSATEARMSWSLTKYYAVTWSFFAVRRPPRFKLYYLQQVRYWIFGTKITPSQLLS